MRAKPLASRRSRPYPDLAGKKIACTPDSQLPPMLAVSRCQSLSAAARPTHSPTHPHPTNREIDRFQISSNHHARTHAPSATRTGGSPAQRASSPTSHKWPPPYPRSGATRARWCSSRVRACPLMVGDCCWLLRPSFPLPPSPYIQSIYTQAARRASGRPSAGASTRRGPRSVRGGILIVWEAVAAKPACMFPIDRPPQSIPNFFSHPRCVCMIYIIYYISIYI
jgi:hypothetical protein